MPAISRAFVDQVKLPAVRRRPAMLGDTPPVELKEGDPQTLVVGSSLIAAAGEVPRQTREDLVNCTLFAQLTATAAVPDQEDIRRWYDAYFKTLAALGWSQSATEFTDYEFEGKNAEAHQAMVQVLTALLGPHAAALVVVKAGLEALQSMNENSRWITLFDRESKHGRAARFQVATAQVDPDGLLQVALAGFNLVTKNTLTQVLFFKFATNSTRMTHASGKATIYESALADVREKVAARLSAYRGAFIGEVKLPPAPVTFLGVGPRKRVRRAAATATAPIPAGAIVLPPLPSPVHIARALLR